MQTRILKKTVALIVTSILTLSCDDFLDTPPYSKKLEDKFYTTEESLVLGHAGCYNALGNKTYEYRKTEFGSIVSDDGEKGGVDAADISKVDQIAYFKDLYSDNSNIKSMWDICYQAIRQCNLFIISAPNVPMKNPVEKERMIAEVKFIRANFYFELLRLYGAVPLLLDKITMSDRNMLRTPVEEVKARIYEDLDAGLILPLASEQTVNQKGRITIGAAQALKARVALYFRDYDVALKSAEDVFNSHQYDLEPDFGNIFRKEGNFGVESVWEIPHSTARAGDGDNNEGSGLPYNTLNVNLGGQGRYRPSENLVDAFEPGDPRLIYTVIVPGDAFEDEVQTDYYYGPPYYNRKTFLVKSMRKTNNDNGELNIKAIRYSDVLLMYAEALLETGGDEETVRSLINSVRNRARNTPKIDPQRSHQEITIADVNIPDVTVTGRDALLKAIQYERRIEFAMEGLRYYDLLRWDIAEEVLHALGATQPQGKGSAFNKAKNSLMPIPMQTIINTGPNFTQNPYYN